MGTAVITVPSTTSNGVNINYDDDIQFQYNTIYLESSIQKTQRHLVLEMS